MQKFDRERLKSMAAAVSQMRTTEESLYSPPVISVRITAA
jgi:hypothetical protein